MSLLRNKLTTRLWVTALTIVIAFGVSLLLLYRVGAVEIRPLHHAIAQLGKEIGSFRGEDYDMDPDIARKVGAIESVSRMYTNPAGVEIAVHVAAFTALGEPTLPHPPKVCYPGSGWTITAEDPVEVPGMDKPARILTVDRDGSRRLVMYWYCWDDKICTTRMEAAMQRLRLVGRGEWPPMIKVLLEMPLGRSPQATLDVLTEFAATVRQSTQDL